jgi:hypothetical protein
MVMRELELLEITESRERVKLVKEYPKYRLMVVTVVKCECEAETTKGVEDTDTLDDMVQAGERCCPIVIGELDSTREERRRFRVLYSGQELEGKS